MALYAGSLSEPPPKFDRRVGFFESDTVAKHPQVVGVTIVLVLFDIIASPFVVRIQSLCATAIVHFSSQEGS